MNLPPFPVIELVYVIDRAFAWILDYHGWEGEKEKRRLEISCRLFAFDQ